MDLASGVADLHLHTTASDGTCSLADRVDQASERGLDAIAITDHDRIPEDLSTRSAHRNGVEVVTGVEVRADALGVKVELLGHFVDPADESLREVLERVRGYRRERNRELVPRVARAAGVDLSFEELRDEVRGSIGRPHLAAKLVEYGSVDSIDEAFETYLAEDGEAYVPMERAPHEDVIEAIHEAGGTVSLAHPGRTKSDRVGKIVGTLTESGLDGIEVWYPYAEGSEDWVERANRLAREHDLLRAGGSDCHGPDSGKFRIGEVRVPRPDFEALRGRAETRRTFDA